MLASSQRRTPHTRLLRKGTFHLLSFAIRFTRFPKRTFTFNTDWNNITIFSEPAVGNVHWMGGLCRLVCMLYVMYVTNMSFQILLFSARTVPWLCGSESCAQQEPRVLTVRAMHGLPSRSHLLTVLFLGTFAAAYRAEFRPFVTRKFQNQAAITWLRIYWSMKYCMYDCVFVAKISILY